MREGTIGQSGAGIPPVEGSTAPTFRLPSLSHGETGPGDYHGRLKVVLAFYPKDNTSGWAKELASFKEEYSKFQRLGAEILAISADSLESHRKFAEKLGGVPFPMLSDEGARVIHQYGVANDRGTGARRSVFVLDKEGRILHANTEFGASNPRHYDKVYEVLQKAE